MGLKLYLGKKKEKKIPKSIIEDNKFKSWSFTDEDTIDYTCKTRLGNVTIYPDKQDHKYSWYNKKVFKDGTDDNYLEIDDTGLKISEYRTLYPGNDNNIIKKQIRIPSELVWDTKDNGEIWLVPKHGFGFVGRFLQPTVVNQDGDAGDVSQEIKMENNELHFIITIDEDWFNAQDKVILDPDFEIDSTAEWDTCTSNSVAISSDSANMETNTYYNGMLNNEIQNKYGDILSQNFETDPSWTTQNMIAFNYSGGSTFLYGTLRYGEDFARAAYTTFGTSYDETDDFEGETRFNATAIDDNGVYYIGFFNTANLATLDSNTVYMYFKGETGTPSARIFRAQIRDNAAVNHNSGTTFQYTEGVNYIINFQYVSSTKTLTVRVYNESKTILLSTQTVTLTTETFDVDCFGICNFKNNAGSKRDITVVIYYAKVGGYYASGDVTIPTETMPVGKKLNDITLTYSNTSPTYSITASILRASDDAVLWTGSPITGGGVTTNYTTSDFGTIDVDFKIKLVGASDGADTPHMEKIEGNFANKGGGGGTSVSNISDFIILFN